MCLDDKIEDLEYVASKIDGKTLKWNILNRLYGLGKVASGLFLYHITDHDPLVFIYTPIILDGAIDTMTGKHHFALYRLLKIHPKYKLKKLKDLNLKNN